MRFVLYHLVQYIWGAPQTLLGSILWALTSAHPQTMYRCARVRVWKLSAGLSLGPFLFIPKDCTHPLLVHEYGHTIQSLLLGPLYIPLMVIPSALWAGLPYLKRLRRRKGISYYSFYTERLADWLGVVVTHEDAMGIKHLPAPGAHKPNFK